MSAARRIHELACYLLLNVRSSVCSNPTWIPLSLGAAGCILDLGSYAFGDIYHDVCGKPTLMFVFIGTARSKHQLRHHPVLKV